jgi:hypothetical protein
VLCVYFLILSICPTLCHFCVDVVIGGVEWNRGDRSLCGG